MLGTICTQPAYIMTSIDFPANVSAEKQEFVRSFYATSDDPRAVDKVTELSMSSLEFPD